MFSAPPEVQATVAVASLGMLGTQGTKKVLGFIQEGTLKIGLVKKGRNFAEVFTGTKKSLSNIEDMLKAQNPAIVLGGSVK